MADSVHMANWLHQFRGRKYEFLIVSSSPHRRLHPKLRSLLVTPGYSMPFLSRYFSVFLWLADRILSDRIRGGLIAKHINHFNPDVVHILEFQNAGYAFLRAAKKIRKPDNAAVLLTPYGSDIYWFANYQGHLRRIKALLQLADAMSCECRRDEELATNLGFLGVFTPRIPAFGALRLVGRPVGFARRNTIVIKGYHNKWGRAGEALKALRRICDQLEGYDLVIYSANLSTYFHWFFFWMRTGLKPRIHHKGKLSQDQLFEIFDRALVFIGLSRSDGISASMVEAMAHGAIPIQSRTSCCGEWMDDGIGGFLVDYEDVAAISAAVIRILRDQVFWNEASQHNLQALQERLDSVRVSRDALQTYQMLQGRLSE